MGKGLDVGALRGAGLGYDSGVRTRRWLSMLWIVIFAGSSVAADDKFFKVFERGGDMRTLTAEFADVNGDGRTDLLQVVSAGIPPNQVRSVRVYLQTDTGGLPTEPSHEIPLSVESAVYDIADVGPDPGHELLLLRPDEVAVLSLAGTGGTRSVISLNGLPSVAAEADERGLDRLRMVYRRKGKTPWIRVPTFKGLLVLDNNRQKIGLLDTAGRANFYVPQEPGLGFVESDIQMYYDAPHISTGDIDGDGREDMLAATRHEIRTFLQKPDGSFARKPTQKLPLGLITPEDHIRGSGGIVVEGEDLNDDSQMDLLITKISGGLSNSRTETRIYLNREGSWDLQKPDQMYAADSTVGLDRLVDLDSDGRPELVREQLRFSVFEFVEALLTRSLDTTFYIHAPAGKGVFSAEPVQEVAVEIPLSFDTFRPSGFIASLDLDLNGDGYRDLLLSQEGDGIDVYLGRPGFGYGRRDARQAMDSRGQVKLGDWNSDGLPDLLLFDPQNPESTLRLVVNQGTLAPTEKKPRRIRPGQHF